MASPVRGFRPWRAARSFTEKVPNPRDADRLAICQSLPDGFEEGSHGCICSGPGDGQLGRDASGEIGFLHVFLPGDGVCTTVPGRGRESTSGDFRGLDDQEEQDTAVGGPMLAWVRRVSRDGSRAYGERKTGRRGFDRRRTEPREGAVMQAAFSISCCGPETIRTGRRSLWRASPTFPVSDRQTL